MGLMPAVVSDRLLSQALEGDLSYTERGWAHLERAHLALRAKKLEPARDQLGQSLWYAWRPDHRAEVFVLRGFVHLRDGQDELALADFGAARGLHAPRRVGVEAHLGRAFAFALRGDDHRLRQEAQAAYVIESGRATVSRLDPFWDLSLAPLEQQAARALLLWGKGEALGGSNSEAAHLARKTACRLLRRAPEKVEEMDFPRAPEEEGSVPWGTLTVASLLSLWGEDCERVATLDSQQEAETVSEGGAEPEPDPSQSSTDPEE
jgi:hypothetical protein